MKMSLAGYDHAGEMLTAILRDEIDRYQKGEKTLGIIKQLDAAIEAISALSAFNYPDTIEFAWPPVITPGAEVTMHGLFEDGISIGSHGEMPTIKKQNSNVVRLFPSKKAR